VSRAGGVVGHYFDNFIPEPWGKKREGKKQRNAIKSYYKAQDMYPTPLPFRGG